MKSEIVIMIAMVALIFVVPGLWMYVRNLRNERQFRNRLFSFAANSNCLISEFDFWKNSAIGIDKNMHRVFYLRDMKDKEIKEQIDLSEIQKCRILNASRSMNVKNGNYTAIDRLELIFISKDKNKPEIGLEFYNTIHDSLAMSGEVQLIEKWSGIVTKELAGIV